MTEPPIPRTWMLPVLSLYAFLVPFQPVLELPGGVWLRVAWADVVAPLVLLAFLVDQRHRLPRGLASLVVAVPLIAIATTLWSSVSQAPSGYAIGKTLGLVYLAGLSLAAAMALPRGGEMLVLRALARGVTASALISLGALVAWLAVGMESSLMEHDRVCGTMPGDPNIYGSLLVVGFLATVVDSGRTLLSRCIGGAILAIGLVATGSRSAMVAMIVGGLACAFLGSRDPWVTAARALYVVMIVAMLATAAMFNSAVADRVGLYATRQGRVNTIDSRFGLYARALEQVREHPFLGLGIGGFRDSNTFISTSGNRGHFVVHNTYLWALVDMGLMGGLTVMALMAAAFWRSAHLARRYATPAAVVIAAGVAGMAAFDLFVDGLYQRHFWILIACALAIAARPQAPARRLA